MNVTRGELSSQKQSLQTRTNILSRGYRRRYCTSVVQVYLQKPAIYCHEWGFELCITNGNTVSLRYKNYFLLHQHNLYSLQNLHDITLLYSIMKVMFYTYILDSVFSNAGCCHTNLMYLNDRQQKEHINNWTTLANW